VTAVLVPRTVILSCIKAGNTEWVILSQNIISHYVLPKQTAEWSESIQLFSALYMSWIHGP